MNQPTDRSMLELAQAAFEQAARKVIERARQTGTPVILWEDGAIVRRSPDSFPAPPDKHESNEEK